MLRHSYRFPRSTIAAALDNLLNMENVQFPIRDAVLDLQNWHARGLDFADALHLATSQHLTEFITFDERFRKRSAGLGGCAVLTPA